jgi:hypothetical protein
MEWLPRVFKIARLGLSNRGDFRGTRACTNCRFLPTIWVAKIGTQSSGISVAQTSLNSDVNYNRFPTDLQTHCGPARKKGTVATAETGNHGQSVGPEHG